MLNNPDVLKPVLYTPAFSARMDSPEKILDLMLAGETPEDGGPHRQVIDLEDSVLEEDVPQALAQLSRALEEYEPTETGVFVRVRDMMVAEQVLDMAGVEKIEGLVIPKVEEDVWPDWAGLVEDYTDAKLSVIPILEAPAMVDPGFRQALLGALLANDDRIDSLLLGSNDLMQAMNMRRDKKLTLWETPKIGTLLDTIALEFGSDFEVSAPVFDNIAAKYDEVFKEEVRRSLAAQLMGQIIIHPRHLHILTTEMYPVDPMDLAEAEVILDTEAKAICAHGGRMLEPATHSNWAQRIKARAEVFGLRAEASGEQEQAEE
jgi:citrate lyase beta subunit